MFDNFFSRRSVEQEFVTLAKHAIAGRLYSERLDALVLELLNAKAEWADEMLLEVLRGEHTDALQDELALSVHFGLRDAAGSRRSFVTLCVERDRLALLRGFAEQGMPDVLRRESAGAAHPAATTDSGKWLDILCSTSSKGQGNEGNMSMPRKLLLYSGRPALHDLADLLAEHDPKHGDVRLLEANPAFAEVNAAFTAALMRARLRGSATADAAADSDNPTPPAPRRRARHV
jgi:hypothetical protein